MFRGAALQMRNSLRVVSLGQQQRGLAQASLSARSQLQHEQRLAGSLSLRSRTSTAFNSVKSRRQFSTNQAPEGAAPKAAGEETTALTTITFKEGARAGVNLMVLGGVVVAVGVCGYLISKELFPSKMSPNSVFNQAFEVVRNHSEVTARLGTPVKGYGRDYGSAREGRRNFIDHDQYVDDDGIYRTRVKFNVEGPNGKAVVFAEQSANSNPGEFSYVILDHVMRGRRDTIALIDNRRELSRSELQDKVTKRLANAGAVLYGHTNCQWTKRQREELGEFAERIKTMYCDKPENEEECKRVQLKGYPTWRVKEQNIPGGFQSLEQLQSLARML